MELQFELSKNQVKQIAHIIFLNLNDIQDCLEIHKEECQQLDIEQKETVKKDCSIWAQYIDDTTCTIPITQNMKGAKQKNEHI